MLSGPPPLSNRISREGVRRLVHVGFGGCAFLVEPLGRFGAAALALAALLYNALLAPRLGFDRAYRRRDEGPLGGIVTYPLAVLLLILLAPPVVAAGAWIVLAVADPAAAAVGTSLKGPRLPGNPRKTVAGSAGALLAGAGACIGALALLGVPEPLVPGLSAAIAGAVAEALPLPFDDNLPVAAAAAVALHLSLAG